AAARSLLNQPNQSLRTLVPVVVAKVAAVAKARKKGKKGLKKQNRPAKTLPNKHVNSPTVPACFPAGIAPERTYGEQ
ncbi:MAG: hypothetical protein ACK5TX_08890, partial [Planctomyces sp.]